MVRDVYKPPKLENFGARFCPQGPRMAPQHGIPGPQMVPAGTSMVVYRPLWPKSAIPDLISIKNMRFERQKFFWWTVPLSPKHPKQTNWIDSCELWNWFRAKPNSVNPDCAHHWLWQEPFHEHWLTVNSHPYMRKTGDAGDIITANFWIFRQILGWERDFRPF